MFLFSFGSVVRVTDVKASDTFEIITKILIRLKWFHMRNVLQSPTIPIYVVTHLDTKVVIDRLVKYFRFDLKKSMKVLLQKNQWMGFTEFCIIFSPKLGIAICNVIHSNQQLKCDAWWIFTVWGRQKKEVESVQNA